ncbi:MAG: decarboxylating 6-phosphogluconate dehydrogenase [Anaerolineales bacterium]|nr:decarboxylating 6-phosphogluconate dehydrogenase [Anaerolineales bacterium]
MELAMIGLGKMGGNMAERLIRGGHRVVAHARTEESIRAAEANGAVGARSLDEVVAKLKPPHVVWMMVPSGEVTETTLNNLLERLAPGDTIVDGGNSNYKDTVRRAAAVEARGLEYVDCGTSGGIWGLTEGYSLMIGGPVDAVERLRPIFETLAPAADTGWGRVGPHGAGHFVKMVHNGIEYGMMQALAEGFEVLHSKKDMQLDVHQIATIWQRGSVVRSWLLDLTVAALAEDADLSAIQGWVADSGEGRWTVAEAIDLDVPAPVITLSLLMRLASRQDESYAAKLLAAMRNQFGGHAVKKA